MNLVRRAALTAFIAGALAAPAQAHVTLAPAELPAGAVGELTFRCPNERRSAATTQLAVEMPRAYPFTLVKVRPVAGWHATIAMRKRATPVRGRDGYITTAVDTITWSGGTIGPGKYRDFTVLAGPMPRGVAELAFKAIQTYADGEVVRWIDMPNAGEAAGTNPAPVLHLHPAPH